MTAHRGSAKDGTAHDSGIRVVGTLALVAGMLAVFVIQSSVVLRGAVK